MHMSEADVVAFAIQQLFEEKHPHAGEDRARKAKVRRKLIREA